MSLERGLSAEVGLVCFVGLAASPEGPCPSSEGSLGSTEEPRLKRCGVALRIAQEVQGEVVRHDHGPHRSTWKWTHDTTHDTHA